MLRYFTFSRPLSGFSSHFCNTHFRDTWFSSLPLFSNYSTGFRICESSKYHSKRFFYSSFTLFSKIRKLTVFSRNPRTLIIPQSVRLRMDADGSFVPKNRLSCRCPAARPVRPAHPARNFPETKKIICPAHAAHVGHMIGGLVQSFPAPPDLPLRGRGTAAEVEGVRAESHSPSSIGIQKHLQYQDFLDSDAYFSRFSSYSPAYRLSSSCQTAAKSAAANG